VGNGVPHQPDGPRGGGARPPRRGARLLTPVRFVLVLHGHIPDVLGHGVWPHGENWLYEAAAESYLPFLDAAERLVSRGAPFKATVGLTPVLCEQLEDERFAEGFVRYLSQRAEAAAEDGEAFRASGEEGSERTALFWQAHYSRLLLDFDRRGRRIVPHVAALAGTGAIEPVASAATHGFLPLLPNDRALLRQLEVGLAAHGRHFGRPSSGFWLPECAYRPGGTWDPPAGGPPVFREGLEEFLAPLGIGYFFVETHLVRGGAHEPAYGGEVEREAGGSTPHRLHAVRTRDGRELAVFARDPVSSHQVWSGKVGYPGDGRYLEFHKRRAPSGHRYWRVTDNRLGLGEKLPWEPREALEALESHADHFVGLLEGIPPLPGGEPPTVVAMFDLELFGHWWFEGMEFLERVFAKLAENPRVVPMTASEALAASGPGPVLALPAGTWGRGGDDRVWRNEGTLPYWRAVCAIEETMERLEARRGTIAPPLFAALERQTLLLHSSDWPFLIDNEVSKDYAYSRIEGHAADFAKLALLAEAGRASGPGFPEIEERDRLFGPELLGPEFTRWR